MSSIRTVLKELVDAAGLGGADNRAAARAVIDEFADKCVEAGLAFPEPVPPAPAAPEVPVPVQDALAEKDAEIAALRAQLVQQASQRAVSHLP